MFSKVLRTPAPFGSFSRRRVAFTAFGKTQNLEAGKLLYLPTGEPHTVKGIENASLLLTILLPKH